MLWLAFTASSPSSGSRPFPRRRRITQLAFVERPAVSVKLVLRWASSSCTSTNEQSVAANLWPNTNVVCSLFFCVTTVLSVYTVQYFKWHNRLPGYDKLAVG